MPGSSARLAKALLRQAPALSVRRARSTFICGHLAAGTPVGVLLKITGIAEAGSLARYARHVAGVSSSQGVLRARCRAERTPWRSMAAPGWTPPRSRCSPAARPGAPDCAPATPTAAGTSAKATTATAKTTRESRCARSPARSRPPSLPPPALPARCPAAPNLAAGLALTRPGEDPRGTAARELASVAARGHKPGWPGYDRAYTQVLPERFHLPARALGYKPVMDYRADQLDIQANTGGATEAFWLAPPATSGTRDVPPSAAARCRAVYRSRRCQRQRRAQPWRDIPAHAEREPAMVLTCHTITAAKTSRPSSRRTTLSASQAAETHGQGTSLTRGNHVRWGRSAGLSALGGAYMSENPCQKTSENILQGGSKCCGSSPAVSST